MITSNASDLIQQLKAYKKDLKQKEERLVAELVGVGTEVANVELDSAVYTGYKNAQIVSEAKGKRGHVSMVGYSAGFIEFGTGMEYIGAEDTHPLADNYGAIRGEWGKGEGKNPPWIYRDIPGDNPPSGTVPLPMGMGTLTYGFPANRTMYNTGKELHQRLYDIVKDVFND